MGGIVLPYVPIHGWVNHIFIFVVSGLVSRLSFTNAPTIMNMTDNGLYTFEGKAAYPPLAGPNFATMFHYVSPSLHHCRSNNLYEPWSNSSRYPSVLKTVKEAFPNITIGSFVQLSSLNNVFEDFQMDKYYYPNTEKLVQKAEEYLKEKRPDIFVIEFEDVDNAGHKFGYDSNEYYEAIYSVDSKISQLISVINSENMYNDSAVFVTSDHGGGGYAQKEHSYFSNNEMDMNTLFIANAFFFMNRKLPNFYNGDLAYFISMLFGVMTPLSWNDYDPRSNNPLQGYYTIIIIIGLALLAIMSFIASCFLPEKHKSQNQIDELLVIE